MNVVTTLTATELNGLTLENVPKLVQIKDPHWSGSSRSSVNKNPFYACFGTDSLGSENGFQTLSNLKRMSDLLWIC